MSTRKVVLLGAVVVICGGFTHTEAADTEANNTLRYGTVTQLSNWDPLRQPGQTYTAIVYEGLVKVAPDGFTVLPGLAESWASTAGSLEFKLRSGVVFHDGTPFDGDAVKKNIERIKNSKSQWAAGFRIVEDVVVKDSTHVILKLSGPAPTLLSRLSTRGAYMVSPAAIADDKWDNAIGTGPWVYDRQGSQLGTKEVFHRFDRYWAPEKAGVETIVLSVLQDPSVALNALRAGEVQLTELESSQLPLAEAEGFRIKGVPSLVQHILFLDRKNIFADENLRKAVCSAADMQAIADASYHGYAKPVSQKMEPGQAGYNPNVKGYGHDLAAAKKYMEATGNPPPSFLLPMHPGNQTAIILFAQQLKAIGIDAQTQLMTTGQFFTYYQTDKYPLQVNSSATESIGPLDYYQFRFAADGTGNPFKVAVPELDAIVARALAEPDPKAQESVWQEMTQYLHDHAHDCGFYEWETTWAFDGKALDDLPVTRMRPGPLRYDEVRLK